MLVSAFVEKKKDYIYTHTHTFGQKMTFSSLFFQEYSTFLSYTKHPQIMA